MTIAAREPDSPARRLAAGAVAVVLAGGKGTRLGPLTAHESKPALPIGAGGRGIDFALSNCINSGIRHIGVATQHCPATLDRHLASVWQPIAAASDVCLETWPAAQYAACEGYRGTADAVFRTLPLILRHRPRHVLVLAGDHVYKMDYAAMLEQHVASGADVTVGCIDVALDEARHFGVMVIATDGRIERFMGNPSCPEPIPGAAGRALASMGIYVFDAGLLQRALTADAGDHASPHDFGHDVIPALIDSARVFAHRFDGNDPVGAGYWRDIGTLSAYWQTQMELLDPDSVLLRTQRQWPVPTLPDDVPQGRHAHDPRWRDALIAPDCTIEDAFITHSVLCTGVRVRAHACVRNAIVLPGASIGRNCYIDKVIVAAGCEIPDDTVIGQPTILRADASFAGIEPLLVTPEWLAGRRRWDRTRDQMAARQNRLSA